MYTMCVVVLPKSFQLLRKIYGIPEERLIKKFAMNGSNYPVCGELVFTQLWAVDKDHGNVISTGIG